MDQYTTIGNYEYLQLFSGILMPCMDLANAAIAPNLYACDTHQEEEDDAPVIVPDPPTHKACVDWVEEIKDGVLSDRNFSRICKDYDMSRLPPCAPPEHDDFFEIIMDIVQERKVINATSEWLVSICSEKKLDVTVFSENPDYSMLGIPMSSVPGLEIKHMTSQYSEALMPSPYGFMEKHKSIVSCTYLPKTVELIISPKGKEKKKTLLRDPIVRYKTIGKDRTFLLTCNKLFTFFQMNDIKFMYGDYYVLGPFVQLPDDWNFRIKQGTDGIVFPDVDPHQCSLQKFQHKRELIISLCTPCRVSSIMNSYKVYDPGYYFATDTLLTNRVFEKNNKIYVSAGEEFVEFAFGNNYLYQILNFIPSDKYNVLSVVLLDEDGAINKNMSIVYCPSVFDSVPENNDYLDNWESHGVEDLCDDEGNLIF